MSDDADDHWPLDPEDKCMVCDRRVGDGHEGQDHPLTIDCGDGLVITYQ